MKHINYIISAFAILLLWSCDSEGLEEVRAFPEGEIVAATITSISNELITKESADAKENFIVEWEPADFGFPASISYSIYMSGPTVSDFPIAEGIYDVSYSVEHKPFYSRLTNSRKLALPKGEVSTVSVYVTATIGSDFTVVKSEPVNVEFDIQKSIK